MGGVWCVELEKMEKTVWFHDGWEKFVEDHFIGYGYLLVFTYGGNSNFNVIIFDLTTNEVEYPLNNSRNFERTKYSTRNSISEKEEISDDDSVKVLDSFPGKPVIVISSLKSGTPSACGDQSTNIRRHYPQTMHDLSFTSAEFTRGVKRGNSDAAERSKSQRSYLTRSKCKIEDEGIKTGSKKRSPSDGDWVTNGRRHNQQTIHDLSFPSAEFTRGVKRGKSDAAETSKSQRCYLTRSKCKIEDGGIRTGSKKRPPSACGDPATNDRRHDHQTMHDLSFPSTGFTGGVKMVKSNAAERSKALRGYLTRSKCKTEVVGIRTGSKKRSPSACGDRATNGRRHNHQTIHDLSFPSAKFTRGVKRGKSDAAERSKSQQGYLTRSKCKIEDGGIKTGSKKTRNLFTKNAQEAIPSTEGNQHFSSNEKQLSSGIGSHSGKKAIDSARKYLPKSPSFTVILKPRNLNPRFSMYVPGAFSKYLSSAPGHIELLDSNGKKWPVRVIQTNRGNEKYLARGWATFARQKNLKVGDVCIFEQIHINKRFLKVSTFCNTIDLSSRLQLI
ncbi:B3 domain-containing transcription factor VRN1-like [Forsythia ovata]|uniref:B3 domain-containing transcription factor VRN1-like n=1 Tax=Forsythia ovata TaxID=205694 RepID=A0ABD1PWS7_9LAMI